MHTHTCTHTYPWMTLKKRNQTERLFFAHSPQIVSVFLYFKVSWIEFEIDLSDYKFYHKSWVFSSDKLDEKIGKDEVWIQMSTLKLIT